MNLLDSHDPITELLPTKGYFHLYQEMTKYAEACPRFHFFTSAAVLGAMVNRKVFFQRGSTDTFPTLYPNPWIILVAPQGVGHKSSSLRVGYKLMMRTPEFCRPKILASKITPEALIKALACGQIDSSIKIPIGVDPASLRPSAIGVLYSSELAVLLGKEKYNTGFINLMTELYDCHDEWSSETVMRGDQRLFNVCMTLMGAITPEGLRGSVPEDAFKTGFMSRIMLVIKPNTWEKKIHNPPPPPIELKDEVLHELQTISQLKGQIVWSKHAEEAFKDWYLGADKWAPGSMMAAYLERKQDHLLRLAILLELSYTYDRFILEEKTMLQALAIMDSIENEAKDLIDYILTEPKMRSAQLILENLKNHGPADEQKLLRETWRALNHPKEFQDMLMLLLRAQLISLETIKGESKYVYSGLR